MGHFLKTDFDKWVDEDEQDEAPEDDLANMGGMGGMPGMGDMSSMMGGAGGDFGGIDFSKLGGAAEPEEMTTMMMTMICQRLRVRTTTKRRTRLLRRPPAPRSRRLLRWAFVLLQGAQDGDFLVQQDIVSGFLHSHTTPKLSHQRWILWSPSFFRSTHHLFRCLGKLYSMSLQGMVDRYLAGR